MNHVVPTLLLIADISGYTRFMQRNPITASHAHQMVARILQALVDTVRPPLKIAEIEGDAVFLFATVQPDVPEDAAAAVVDQVRRMFRAFDEEITMLQTTKTCVCSACRNVHELKLKHVIHAGEVAVEKVDRFEKLFGLDVIIAHRLLKNTIREKEYVLMTPSAYALLRDSLPSNPKCMLEHIEEIGDVETLVLERSQLEIPAPTDRRRAGKRLSTFLWKMKMHARVLLKRYRSTAPA